MSISQVNLKMLWAPAAGRCAFPDCSTKQLYDPLIGEMAHIRGEKPGSRRYDEKQNNKDRNSYENLILLCPNHHTEIDSSSKEEIYTVEKLLKMKSEHENKIRNLCERKIFKDKYEVAKLIWPLLVENHRVFVHYGPISNLAHKSPHNESAAKQWFYRRLSTIVPNNRKINDIITASRALFLPDEQAILADFSLHADSYETWLTEEPNYDTVVRFPVHFRELIEGILNACK